MAFTHKAVKLPNLVTTTLNKKRFYNTPEGKLYPSITTVLSIRKKDGLIEWRKRVGDDVANYISGNAVRRGIKIHEMCEDYLNNMYEDALFETYEKEHFLYWCLFKQLRDQALCDIDNIYVQEVGLYSDKYKVAGRVDCIAEFNGVLSVIDFKTSTKERTDGWNENYYIQGAAYAEMFEERTEIKVNQIVILVVTEDGTVQKFVKNKYPYLELLVESVTKWEERNEIPKSTDSNVSIDGMHNK
tara:strand:+ start:593 stop:1321 length:729 start_codon:yes stop_codon:yes gene_type:complete